MPIRALLYLDREEVEEKIPPPEAQAIKNMKHDLCKALMPKIVMPLMEQYGLVSSIEKEQILAKDLLLGATYGAMECLDHVSIYIYKPLI